MNVHLHALFSAVEHGHLEKAKTILESTDIDINSLNRDRLSVLDVAVLSNNRLMTKMLLQHGASEGNHFEISSSLSDHLSGLLAEAESRFQDLNNKEIKIQPAFNTKPSIMTGIDILSENGKEDSDVQRDIDLWERRVKGLKRMLLGWDQARAPDMPTTVTVDVVGLTSVVICILEPMEGSLCSKFQVQWSTRPDFSNVVGEKYLFEWTCYQRIMGTVCKITDLTQGHRYYFRASCGNMKGWGPFRQSVPFSVIPSGWRDFDNKENRFYKIQPNLDEIFMAVCLARPAGTSELSLCISNSHRKNPRKKASIKQLFSTPAKFQKNLKRGIYLACIFYYDERVLVTNEDFLPVIEIDETYPSSLNTDFLWLMKVSCTWSDVKLLRADMERSSISTLHFRLKLLTAAHQMQSALNTIDLGQLFYKPIKDSNGTIIFCTVNIIKSIKNISVPNSRWVAINKMQKKITSFRGNNSINEILINSVTEQINYTQNSNMELNRGLYLGYLKMLSSVDQIQVIVPAATPNVLPYCKIRDNPHVSVEEWEILKCNKLSSPTPEGNIEIQQIFLESLIAASNRLLSHINISRNATLTHRLYNVEVIELNSDVSFLIMCPPIEFCCAISEQLEIHLERSDLISLPLQTFEIIQFRTYYSNIIQKYLRLSCILELDTALATHSYREAFSTLEIETTKERLTKLQELTKTLNNAWKKVRWLTDVSSFVRDKESKSGITVKELLEFSKIKETSGLFCTSNQRQLPQFAITDNSLIKSTSDRGSWPSSVTSICLESKNLVITECSRSEHDLNCTSANTKVPCTTSKSKCSSRKNSVDYLYFSAGENFNPFISKLPPSKSEDTLVKLKKRSKMDHRKRSTIGSSNLSTSYNRLDFIDKAIKNTIDSTQKISNNSQSPLHQFLLTSNKLDKKHTEIGQIHTDNINFLNPTLTALQNEIKFFKDPLYTKPSDFYRRCLQRTSDNEDLSVLNSNKSIKENRPSGVIQVYAAYETGLAHGTSLKLHVTPKTTAREVVDLIVKQLNMAVVLKGKDGPIYTSEKLENFCLVAVIGARERCLRDDFKPLHLQNPWKKGRLYVRQKHDLLAAIEYSNKETQII